MKVRDVKTRITLNSKAEPTLEVCVNGFCASPPSGTSRSSKEVEPWAPGKDVDESVRKTKREIDRFLQNIIGKDVDPVEVEEELISERSRIGGNGVLSLSIALYKAAAHDAGIPVWKYLSQTFGTKPSIPKPLENTIGGGKHGGNTSIQEFLLFPRERGTMEEYIHTLSRAYREVKGILKERDPHFKGTLTLESAWVSSLPTEEILSILREVADRYDLSLGVDVAASDFYEGGAYHWQDGMIRDREAQIDYIVELSERYGLEYVEDPLEENDPEGFVEVQRRIEGTVVGDDLFATNIKYLVKGVGGALIKYNQRGSILETVETVKRAREMGMKIIVSHRSGETDDPFLSHFAVAVGADLIKAGAAGIRTVKLNELLRIFSE